MQAQQIFKRQRLSVLIVGRSFSTSKTDRHCLARLGITDYRFCSSEKEFFSMIEERRPNIIVCNTDRSGIDFPQLIDLLDKHPEHYFVPRLFIIPKADEKGAFERAENISAVLPRPFSLEDLQNAILKAMSWTFARKRGLMPQNTPKAFQAALERFLEPAQPEEQRTQSPDEASFYQKAQDTLKKARLALAAKNYEQAIGILNSFLWPDEFFCAESALLLSKIWQEKGYPERCQNYLLEAGMQYASVNKADKVQAIFAEMLKLNPEARNPYQALAANLMNDADYAAAALAYLRLFRLDRDRRKLINTISRDCFFTAEPIKSARELCRHLSGKMLLPKESELFQILMGTSEFNISKSSELEISENSLSAFQKTLFIARAVISIGIYTSKEFLKINKKSFETAA